MPCSLKGHSDEIEAKKRLIGVYFHEVLKRKDN